MKHILIFVFILFPFLASGQTQPDGIPVTFVVRDEWGKPLPKAIVKIDGKKGKASGNDGQKSFTSVPKGRDCVVTTVLEGFQTQRDTIDVFHTGDERDNSHEITLKRPDFEIWGRVVDSAGVGLSDIPVSFLSGKHHEGDTTELDGSFVFVVEDKHVSSSRRIGGECLLVFGQDDRQTSRTVTLSDQKTKVDDVKMYTKSQPIVIEAKWTLSVAGGPVIRNSALSGQSLNLIFDGIENMNISREFNTTILSGAQMNFELKPKASQTSLNCELEGGFGSLRYLSIGLGGGYQLIKQDDDLRKSGLTIGLNLRYSFGRLTLVSINHLDFIYRESTELIFKEFFELNSFSQGIGFVPFLRLDKRINDALSYYAGVNYLMWAHRVQRIELDAMLESGSGFSRAVASEDINMTLNENPEDIIPAMLKGLGFQVGITWKVIR